jgi:hypothetical protein
VVRSGLIAVIPVSTKSGQAHIVAMSSFSLLCGRGSHVRSGSRRRVFRATRVAVVTFVFAACDHASSDATISGRCLAAAALESACAATARTQLSTKGWHRSQLATELLAGDLLTTEWNARIAEVLPTVLAGTPYEARWVINGQPAAHRLSLYVLRPNLGARALDLPAAAESARDNCAVAAAPNVIVCDAGFLDTMFATFGFDEFAPRGADGARFRTAMESALLLWILGHEIGHVVNGDAPSHFAPGALVAVTSVSTLMHRRELTADSFFVARASADTARGRLVSDMAMNLINQEIRRKVGAVPPGVGILFDYTNRKVVTYLSTGTHPEFIVRSTRMLGLLSQKPPFEYLAPQLSPFLRHLREAARRAAADSASATR